MSFQSTFRAFLYALSTTHNAGKPQPLPDVNTPGYLTTDGDGRLVFVSPTPGGVEPPEDYDNDDE
jgi:hypothetical protein